MTEESKKLLESIEQALEKADNKTDQSMQLNTLEERNCVSALQMFADNWCIDRKLSEQSDDVEFRCEDCPFKRDDDRCSVMIFAGEHKVRIGAIEDD